MGGTNNNNERDERREDTMAKQAKLWNFFQKSSQSNILNDNEDESVRESDSEDAETADPVAPAAAKKRKNSREFRPDWRGEFPWLRWETNNGKELMSCSVCEKGGEKNGPQNLSLGGVIRMDDDMEKSTGGHRDEGAG